MLAIWRLDCDVQWNWLQQLVSESCRRMRLQMIDCNGLQVLQHTLAANLLPEKENEATAPRMARSERILGMNILRN